MQRAGQRVFGADFDAGEKIEVQAFGLGGRLLDAGDRVVVGQGQGRQADLNGQTHNLRRRQRAVGSGGMAVKIDE